MADETTTTVIELIQQLAPHLPAGIHANTPLLDSGMLDSLFVIALIEALEKSFGVRLATEDLTNENFSNAQSIAELVARTSVAPAR